MGLFSRWRRKRSGSEASYPEAEARDYTLAELALHDGSDLRRPLLLAVRGVVYDVGGGKRFYGPGGPYASFAGKDCTRALAKLDFDPSLFCGDLEGLEDEEIDRLEDWIETFEGKYRRAGRLLPGD